MLVRADFMQRVLIVRGHEKHGRDLLRQRVEGKITEEKLSELSDYSRMLRNRALASIEANDTLVESCMQ